MRGESPEAVCLIKNPEYRRICKKEVEKRSSRPKACCVFYLFLIFFAVLQKGEKFQA